MIARLAVFRDWTWRVAAFSVLAALGALAAIAVSDGATKKPPPATTTAPATQPTLTQPTTTAAPPRTTVVTTTPQPTPHPTGWVIVLQSLPADAHASAAHTAAAARAAALLHIGVLLSSDYRTLRPGYLVVYQGPFANEIDAQGAIRFARAAGFPSAYSRQISR